MKTTLEEDLAKLFGSKEPLGVVSVYLFGSQAEGRGHRESDVDVGVLLDRDAFPSRRDRFEERLRLTGELGAVLHRNDVDLVILNDAPPELGARIVTTGNRLYCSARPRKTTPSCATFRIARPICVRSSSECAASSWRG